MIINNREMYDFKNKLAEDFLLECYMNTLVEILCEEGKLSKKLLENIRKIRKNENYLKDSIRKSSFEEITNNEYLKNIKIPEVIRNRFKLSNNRKIKANKLTVFSEIETFMPRLNLFICDKNMSLPAITEENDSMCWMSVEPFEINSFSKIINDSKGNVLLLGCGLGYAAYMISQKEEVKSVTIVEIDEDVITLFIKNILPKFPNKHKIKVINENALTYLDTVDLNKFSYINLDIYKNANDMLEPYLYTLCKEKEYPNVKFSYWLENEFKTFLQMAIIRVFTELNTNNYIFDVIASDLLLDKQFNSKEELREFLKLDNLRTLLRNWYKYNSDKLNKSKASLDIISLKLIDDYMSKFKKKKS